jgi:hypothetical protein
MMVCYKGSYCIICQYMLKKPWKWGKIFWVLANFVSKFIYCFEIYCEINLEAKDIIPVYLGQGVRHMGWSWSWKRRVVINVIMKFLQEVGIAYNFYTSKGLRKFIVLPTWLFFLLNTLVFTYTYITITLVLWFIL